MVVKRHVVTVLVLTVGVLIAVAPAARSQQFQSPEIVISDLPIDQYLPQVAYNSRHKEYLVVWHNTWPAHARDIYGKRINQFGNVISEFVIVSAVKDRGQPSVAYDPIRDRYLVVWMFDEAGTGANWDVNGRFVPWNGPTPALPEFSINTWTSSQWSPKVEYAGTQEEFMVVWANDSSGVPWYLSAQRIDAASGALTGGAFTVTSGAEDRLNHDLAYDQERNEFLVVFQLISPVSQDDIYGVRMTAGGAILGAGDFAIADWPGPDQDPAVGASRIGDMYMVAWHDVHSSTDHDTYVRMVNGDGTVAGPAALVVRTPVTESDPDVACDSESTTCLVAWEQRYSSATGAVGISARRVALDGAMSNIFTPRPVYVGEVIDCSSPVIAAGRSGWLVVWEHDHDPAATSDQDIHARVAFDLFSDGFETGDPSMWSSYSP
jgi:hypothetical protein